MTALTAGQRLTVMVAPIEEQPRARGRRPNAARGDKNLRDSGERDVRRHLDQAEDESLVRIEPRARRLERVRESMKRDPLDRAGEDRRVVASPAGSQGRLAPR